MAAVKYMAIDGEQVSSIWLPPLMQARHDGVRFNVNEGHRTFARQWYFWTHQPPLAAYPSPTAPHINTGNWFHAIDFNNAEGVRQYFWRKWKIRLNRTVRWPNGSVREEWHLEVDPNDRAKMVAVARQLGTGGTDDKTLHIGMTGTSVIKLKKLLYAKGVKNFSGKNNSNRYIPFFGKYTEAAVKRFQRTHGLKADGVAGPSTWKALRSK